MQLGAPTGGRQGAATINEQDVRSRIVQQDRKIDLRRETQRRVAAGGPAAAPVDDSWPWELFAFVGIAFAVVLALGAFIAWFIINYLAD